MLANPLALGSYKLREDLCVFGPAFKAGSWGKQASLSPASMFPETLQMATISCAPFWASFLRCQPVIDSGWTSLGNRS